MNQEQKKRMARRSSQYMPMINRHYAAADAAAPAMASAAREDNTQHEFTRHWFYALLPLVAKMLP